MGVTGRPYEATFWGDGRFYILFGVVYTVVFTY